MAKSLWRLAPQFRSEITGDFLIGRAALDVAKHMQPFHRGVDLTPLINIVDKAMLKFGAARPEESDQWLAPRVHATLRLTRMEAADQRVWDFLAVVTLQNYVRWRWAQPDDTNGTDKVGPERFSGREMNKHAVARLWWGAELTRNGSSYNDTSLLFVKQDIQNSWFKTRLFRHRPTAIASLRLLSQFNDGDFATDDQQRDLVKSFNIALTTTMLDAVAESPCVDSDAVREWIAVQPDETLMFDELPVGPPEEAIDEGAISAVRELLDRVVSRTRFAKRDRTPQSVRTREVAAI
ncbi:MAG: DUF6339 family protein [Planctomycetaceae bacterium]